MHSTSWTGETTRPSSPRLPPSDTQRSTIEWGRRSIHLGGQMQMLRLVASPIANAHRLWASEGFPWFVSIVVNQEGGEMNHLQWLLCWECEVIGSKGGYSKRASRGSGYLTSIVGNLETQAKIALHDGCYCPLVSLTCLEIILHHH